MMQGFIIQGGDPTGTGRGGQSIYGYAWLLGFGALVESYCGHRLCVSPLLLSMAVVAAVV